MEFTPSAERAALPNIVDEDDLITANAIDSASWSTALCVGAMLGGIVVSIWGTRFSIHHRFIHIFIVVIIANSINF